MKKILIAIDNKYQFNALMKHLDEKKFKSINDESGINTNYHEDFKYVSYENSWVILDEVSKDKMESEILSFESFGYLTGANEENCIELVFDSCRCDVMPDKIDICTYMAKYISLSFEELDTLVETANKMKI